MGFSLDIAEGPPTADGEPVDRVVIDFLDRIGFLSRGYDPKARVRSVSTSPPYTIFLSMVREPWRDWSPAALARAANTSLPTVYRHLAKLRTLDLIAGGEGRPVHVRHYDLVSAWGIVEANADAAVEANGRVVRELQRLLTEGQGRPAASERVERAPPFWIRIAEVRPEPGAAAVPPARRTKRTRKASEPGGARGLLLRFLRSIGYLNTQGTGGPLPSSLAFRVVADGLLPDIDHLWTAEDLARQLRAGVPMVTRHLQRLESMMLVERASVGSSRPPKRAYRIRDGDLTRAWAVAEVHAALGMESYKGVVRHLADLAPASTGRPVNDGAARD